MPKYRAWIRPSPPEQWNLASMNDVEVFHDHACAGGI